MDPALTSRVRRLRDRPVIVALAGVGIVALIELVLILVDPDITRAVPLLLLLVPITLTAVVGGWKASVPVALFSGLVYSLSFLAPKGVVRIGLTEDTITLVWFVVVAIVISVIASSIGAAERERDEQRAVLLRSVSHDLRNPLATIRAASAELRDGLVTDDGARSALLDLVVAESDRLDRIVANLLSLSRVEAGRLDPDQEPEDLADIVDASVRRLGRDIRVHVCLPADLPDVDVDRTQIDQVITNLLENGLRHGGGTPVVVTATTATNGVEVTISDSGPGFSARARTRPAEFFSPDGTTGVEGVGLAVCKAIVEAHGGTIRVGDQPGGGARISFSLPQA